MIILNARREQKLNPVREYKFNIENVNLYGRLIK